MQIVENAEINQRIKTLLDRIPQEVDRMVAQLKSSLINPVSRPGAKRGLWDRFKNTMSNLWWGRQNQDNPYFWKNKLGDDLGHTESVHHGLLVPIEEYRILKNQCKILEEQLEILLEADNFENLAMAKIINQWGEQLKGLLVQIVKDYIGPSVTSTTTRPARSPAPVDHSATDVEISNKKQNLRQKLNDLAGTINNNEVYTKIRKFIDDDELQKAEVELSRYESGEVTPLSQELIDLKSTVKENLQKALEKGLPHEKYDSYKKIIDDATDRATLDQVSNILNRTATIDAIDEPDSKTNDDPEPATSDVLGSNNSKHAVFSYFDKKPPTVEIPDNVDPFEYWNSMGHAEKSSWDQYGGGLAHDVRLINKVKGTDQRIVKFLDLPWILRIGDPRLKILEKRRSHILGPLQDQQRIELPSDPIRDREDFEERVKQAQKAKAKLDQIRKRGHPSQEEKLARELGGEHHTSEINDEPEALDPTTRTVEMPAESMPDNLPNEQEDQETRTYTLEDDDVDNKTAFDRIEDAKNDLSEEQYDQLIDLMTQNDTYGAMRALRKMLNKDEEPIESLDDWVVPTGILRRKLEYYKEMLKRN